MTKPMWSEVYRDGDEELTTPTVLLSATLGIVTAAASTTGTAQPPPSATANLWLLALAVNTPVLAWWLITEALPKYPPRPHRYSYSCNPPTLASVWGMVLFGEPATTLRIAGLTLALAATAVVAAASNRPTPATAPANRERLGRSMDPAGELPQRNKPADQ